MHYPQKECHRQKHNTASLPW